MFNEIIVSNFSNPSYSGAIERPSAEFEVGNDVCGDRIKIQLVLDEGKVEAIVFKAWGCAASVATGNVFCKTVHGLNISQLQDVHSDSTKSELLGELEPPQMHCYEILEKLFSKIKELDVERVS